MAIVSNTYERGSHTVVKEDVDSILRMFEREETPIFVNSKNDKAENTYVEWATEALAASAANALVEGGALSAAAATAPTRVGNHTQIFSKTISVTRTNEAVSKYGIKSEINHQLEKRMKEIKRDIELAICANTASNANVSDTTARHLGGLPTWLTSNVSRGYGGSSGGFSGSTTSVAIDGTQRALTYDKLLSVAKTCYDNGARPKQIMTGSFNKLKISGFSGNASNMNTDKKAISSTVTRIETDFGTFDCMINPQMRTRDLFFIDPTGIKIATLDKLKKEKLAKTNDSTEFAITTELTTKVWEKSLAVIADLTTA
jgi:hypothetical protein